MPNYGQKPSFLNGSTLHRRPGNHQNQFHHSLLLKQTNVEGESGKKNKTQIKIGNITTDFPKILR